MARWPTWTQKRVTFERLGYMPNPAQLPIHQTRARIIQIVGAERAGKSTVSALECAAREPWADRVGFVADEYDEARKEFAYFAESMARLGNIAQTSTPARGQWFGKTRTGCVFQTISLHTGTDELTGTGEPFDLVVLCEAGLIGYDGFTAARGRVAETRGVVIASGTLWDNVGWYADLYMKGQGPNPLKLRSFSLPAWSNTAAFPGGKDDPEILAWRESLDAEEAARRIDAVVMPSPARMFPQFSVIDHVKAWARFDPGGDVVLAIDAGYYPSRYAVLALQFRKDDQGRECLHVIDEVWEHNKTHPEIVEICKARTWWDNVTQALGGHEVSQHQAAESTQEVWQALCPGLFVERFDAGHILDGAARVRWLLQKGRLFLSPQATGTAWEFGHYQRKHDRAGNVTSEQPEDKNNDAMDALRTAVVWRFGFVEPQKGRVEKPKTWGSPWG